MEKPQIGIERYTGGAGSFFKRIWDDSFDQMCYAKMIFDKDGTPIDYIILDINTSMERELGLTRDQVIGQRYTDLVPRYDESWMRKCGVVVRSGKALSVEYSPKQDLRCAVQIIALDRENEFITISRKITDDKRTEEADRTEQKSVEKALQESEEWQGLLLSISDAVRTLADPVEIQSAFVHMTMEYFGADRCYYYEIENDRGIIRCDASRGDFPPLLREYSFGDKPIHKSLVEAGEPIIVPDVKTTALIDENLRQIRIEMLIISYLQIPVIKKKKAVGMFCITQSSPRNWTESQVALAQDIAHRMWSAVERAQAEEEVRKTRDYLEEMVAARTAELYLERQKLFNVLDNLPAAICLLASDYSIPFANRTFWERYHRPDGRPCYKLIYDRDQPCTRCESFRPLKTGQPHDWIRTTEDNRILKCLNFPFTGVDEERMVLEVIVDITEKRKMEAEMARLGRLTLVGKMAAGIAHEIRNPMTAVRGFLQILGARPEYADDQEFFDIMIDELDRANDIISEFLGLARDKVVNLKPCSLDVVVQTLYPMLKSKANLREVEILLDLKDPPQVLLDENEIRQLILNMFTNAIDAMPSRGTVTIGTVRKGEEAILFVKDEGSGLAPEVIDNLGTPFVTTKEYGTGLGLAACYSIAARHQARIEYETGPKGTVFYVHFPPISR
jgi:signal transduction histidine kinase